MSPYSRSGPGGDAMAHPLTTKRWTLPASMAKDVKPGHVADIDSGSTSTDSLFRGLMFSSSSCRTYSTQSTATLSSLDSTSSDSSKSTDSLIRYLLQPPVPTRPPSPTPSKPWPAFSTGSEYKSFDPFMIGLVKMQEISREFAQLEEELRKEEEEVTGLKKDERGCPCDIPKHPKSWTLDIIKNIHHYSFLLDCGDLRIKREQVAMADRETIIVVVNVPMVDGDPWKNKAEQSLRFVDVELGIGDLKLFDAIYYKQPCDRKMFLVIMSHQIMGVVVAERVEEAYPIVMESQSYQYLEKDPVPVRVGINKLWVHVSVRRQHLATILCDTVGRFFYEGERLKKEDYAFNRLSDLGATFAKVYLKTERIPVYFGKTGIKM